MQQNILVIAATEFEIQPLLSKKEYPFSVLITGVGLINTLFSLMQHLSNNQYETILQVGIAGSFNYDKPLTELVEVTQEQIGDLGAENHKDFIPFDNTILTNEVKFGLREVKSISVNSCSGCENTIHNRIQHFNPDIENMEGYAFFKVCQELGLNNYHQIRATSNYVEPRNKANWQTKKAIEKLNDFILNQINY